MRQHQTGAVEATKSGGEPTKVINLIKSIEQKAEEESHDPILIEMADRAREVQSQIENRQKNTSEALGELLDE